MRNRPVFVVFEHFHTNVFKSVRIERSASKPSFSHCFGQLQRDIENAHVHGNASSRSPGYSQIFVLFSGLLQVAVLLSSFPAIFDLLKRHV